MKIILKKIFCIGSMLLALMPPKSLAQEIGADSIVLSPYKPFPIVAWYSLRGEHATLENFRDLKAAGFTHNISFDMGEENEADIFQLCQRVGLKNFLLLNPSWITYEQMVSDVAKYKNHPALAGYFIYDEPTLETMPMLADWVSSVREQDDKAFCYINLFPNIGNPNYKGYVDRFTSLFPHIKTLSFDHYPILSTAINSEDRTLRISWYENLEIISQKAKRSNLPFWAFALATAHASCGAVYPIPTLKDLRLQIYSNLAYGAQGIQYFTYFADPSLEGFFQSPCYNGQKTGTYDIIKDMNEELRPLLDNIFYGAEVQYVYHTGNTPQGTAYLNDILMPQAFNSLKTSLADGALVSFIKNKDKQYMLLVNRDLNHFLRYRIELTPQGDESWQNYEVRYIEKDGVTSSIIGTSPFIGNLNPGDIAIFSYTGGWKFGPTPWGETPISKSKSRYYPSKPLSIF